jgi:hypothetical protein
MGGNADMEKCIRKRSWINFRYYTDNLLDGLSKNTTKLILVGVFQRRYETHTCQTLVTRDNI